MSDHVYKPLELTGTSTTGVDDAIRNAIARAGKTVHKLRWFQVIEERGGIDGGQVSSWQGDDQGRLHARRLSARPAAKGSR